FLGRTLEPEVLIITNVEKHFGNMCQRFAEYVCSTAKLRDKADNLVREIGRYADTETSNLKKGMRQFAGHLAMIEDYREARVERLKAKVIGPLKSYGSVVKHTRKDLKAIQSVRDREAKHMTRLEKTIQKNPLDWQIIFQAKSELQRATMDATRTTKQLEETIEDFEKHKIQDLKKIFSEFVEVEMSFHAKALESYTLAFQSIQSVDEERNLEVFRDSLHPPNNN
uniref:Family with sequence similarity 92 member A1 n=1 Tax=Gouania willdenowi TaxID=441366 RepID=A0A8C5GGI6_GOUWI